MRISAFSFLFALHWKRGCRAQIHWAGEKARALNKVYTCPFYVIHIHSEFLCFRSMLHAHAILVSPCCMSRVKSLLHVHASCPLCISILYICPRCMSMSMPHVLAAYPCCPCFTSFLHIHASCPCHMSRLHVHAACLGCMSLPHIHATRP